MVDDIALETCGLDFAYYEGTVLKGIDVRLRRGELTALIGPNGSGKTTLLKALSGVLAPRQGQVRLEGTDLRRLTRRQIARRIAVVPQETATPFVFTAWEMVMLGRTPHVRPWAGPGPHDREVVAGKMSLTGTLELAARPLNELSGGERQRVIIAMALAQEAEVLLLDEPTVHLDISHQVEVLELIKRLNRQEGLTVLSIMHDLNLAALYFDRLWLLNGGRIVAQGTPAEVLQEEAIRQAFQAEVLVQAHPTHPAPQIVVVRPTG